MALDPITAKAIASGVLKLGALAHGDKNDNDFLGKALSAFAVIFISFCLLVAALLSIFTIPIDGLEAALQDFTTENRDEIFPVNVSYPQIGKYPMPCDSSYVNSPFGARTHPITGAADFHTGIDFAASYRSPVVAIADGKVKKTGVHRSYGRYVSVKHEDFTAFYAHLSVIYAVPGLEVSAGDVLGLEGGDPNKDTLAGSSTGHHLHFEILDGFFQKQVDPYDYILKPPDDEDEDENSEDDEQN
ncbi:MAG: M23 family metallopeptidase [Oscillospiraceae bacterium]